MERGPGSFDDPGGGAPPEEPPGAPGPAPEPESEPFAEPPPSDPRVGTGEHDITGEYRRPPRRPGVGQRRHRDLPAKVRRRQAIGLIALIVIVGLVAYVAFGRGGGGDEEQPLGLKRLIGQSFIAKMGQGGPDKALLRRARLGEIGGVIVTPRNEDSMQTDVRRLQRAASQGDNPPLLVMIDQEGGQVKRLPNGPPDSSPQQMGQSGDTDQARTEGENTGRFLATVGANVDLAPVLDVSRPETPGTIASRTFGPDASRVAELGTAFAEGLTAGGVAPTAKHFPGLGYADENTDTGAATVDASQAEIRADLTPFQAAIDAGVPLVMVSNAIYPALGSEQPAAFSREIIGRELRRRLGFEGAVITDDLEADAIAVLMGAARAAGRSLRAGADLLLFARTTSASEDAYRAIVNAAGNGRFKRSLLEETYSRVIELKDSIADLSSDSDSD